MSPFRRIGVVTCLVSSLLATAAMAAEPPRTRLHENGAVLVDGKPFLPIFVWAQPSSLIEFQKDLGFNSLHIGDQEAKDPTPAYLDKAHTNGLMVLVDDDRWSESISRHPAVLAWTVEHEPDMPEPPAYQPDLAGQEKAVWIEGEAAESTFQPNPWLNITNPKLSGGKWLSTDPAGKGKATYEFTVADGGTYHLWVREFGKAWANPTRWQLDQQTPKETPRTLKGIDQVDLGGGRAVAWADYGTVQLEPGKHTLSFEVVPGRTSGDAKKPPTPAAIWAIDAICLTPSAKPPASKTSGFVARRDPSVQVERFQEMRRRNPQALTWVILTPGFFKQYKKLPMEQYEQWIQHTDIVSFDYYPVTGWNRPEGLPEVGLATKTLVDLTPGSKPVWSIVEASDQQLSWTSPQTRGVTPQEMRAEAWMSVAAGAKGIGYFTIAFGRGKNFQWNNLTDEIKAELRRTNAELAELTVPIVMGDTDKTLTVSGDASDDKIAENRAILAIRKEVDGKTWVIATNVTRKPVKPTFTLGDPPAGKSAKVWKESRDVTVQNGSFTDTFEPLAVHVYVIE